MSTYDLTTTIPLVIDKDDILNCPYSGNSISLVLPAGTFILECWGAQGGKYSSGRGGYGGYSKGTLSLSDETDVFLYTGGSPGGSATTASTAAGFNGGSATSSYGGGGGGGSDIRIGADSLYARVIVAGGGGGNGYSSASPGGYGGGTTGGAGTKGSYAGGGGGTATSGGTCYSMTGYGKFGEGGYMSTTGGGAGGGWYGGGHGYSGSTDSAGGGGSGYVYTSSTATYYPSGCLLESSYYLADASTSAGSTTFISPTGSSETGHQGNGYIRITVLEVIETNNLECYVKRTGGTWKRGKFWNKQGNNWIKDLIEIPYTHLKLTIPVLAESLEYDGNVKTPTWLRYVPKYITVGGVTSATEIGTYETTFKLNESTYKWTDNTAEIKSISWDIAKARLTIPTISVTPIYYTGNPVSPIWIGYDNDKMTISGTTSATELGTYVTTFALVDTTNYQWSDNTIEDKSITWEIAEPVPASGMIISMDLGNGNRQYRILKLNGNIAEVLSMYTPQSANWTNTPSSNVVTFESRYSSSIKVYGQKYSNTNIDVALTQTFYNSLSEEAHAAIVPKTITQAVWSTNGGVPVISGTYGTSTSGMTNYTVYGTDYIYPYSTSKTIYLLSIADIHSYLSDISHRVEPTIEFSNQNIWKLFWDTETQPSNYQTLALLDSSSSNNKDSNAERIWAVMGYTGRVATSYPDDTYALRPAFQIDLSKIDWQFVK